MIKKDNIITIEIFKSFSLKLLDLFFFDFKDKFIFIIALFF
jgi:hypothetical protein